MMTSTAAVAMPRAIHWATRSRSCSTSTPSSTVTIGLMKYPRLVSTTCPVRVAIRKTCQLT